MHKRKIPTIDYLKGIANIDEKIYENVGDEESYNSIWKYYTEFSDIDILKYTFKKDGEIKSETRTMLGIDRDKEINIGNIKVHDSTFSEYTEDNLEEMNVTSDTNDNNWNDTITDVIYKDNTFHIGESNYYSYTLATRLLWKEIKTISDKKLEDIDRNDFPLRNEILGSLDKLKKPSRPRALTSGGVVVMNTGEEWRILLCRRSSNVTMNKNRLSIIPNGKMTYENAIDNTFNTTLEKKFITELFSNNSQGKIFFDKHITTHPVSAGWNLRDGDFSLGYILIINSPVAYDVFRDTLDNNDEIQEIIEVPIHDIDKIVENINFEKMSPTPISTVCESLRYMNKNESYPDLPYEIIPSEEIKMTD